MILAGINQSMVNLQVAVTGNDGASKFDIVNAKVRVYQVTMGGNEIVQLGSVAMSRVGTSNIWRYVWDVSGNALSTGEYSVEYSLEDSGGLEVLTVEDLIVRDIAKQSVLTLVKDELEFVKKIESGRWKIVNNQMLFYDNDGVTPILTFDLFDELGLPTMNNVLERKPV